MLTFLLLERGKKGVVSGYWDKVFAYFLVLRPGISRHLRIFFFNPYLFYGLSLSQFQRNFSPSTPDVCLSKKRVILFFFLSDETPSLRQNQ